MRKLFIFFSTFLLVEFVKNTNLQCENIEINDRFDCFPENGATEKSCEQRGCCWSPVLKTNNAEDLNPPNCFFPKNFPNYKATPKSSTRDQLVYSLEKNESTFRPNEILKLEAKIIFETKQRLRVQITDPNNPRYQVPMFNRDSKKQESSKIDETDYQIFVNEDRFAIKVYRKSTGKIIFDTSLSPLIYADQYIQYSTGLVNNFFYGMGEHQASLALNATWSRYTLWNRDIGTAVDLNLYGSHPFYMSIDKDGDAMGFYFLNSNAMDVKVNPSPALTFITIGGIIDFYIYLGPSPSDVISQHTQVIGRSQMPQYFTLGFHLCRWGYTSSKEVAEVIKRNRAIGIPYDVQWTDIDSMIDKLDWTYDPEKFGSLPEIVEDLHKNGQHFVTIIDPGISNKPGVVAYETGLEQNVFIKYYNSSEPLVGEVWPGRTVYPDFTNPNTTKWWTELAQKFHSEISYDGLWIDMNEPSNFVNGSINGCPGTTYDNPPYVPKVLDNALHSKTICPSSQQYLSNHYNLHNLYGYFESISTYYALLTVQKNKRPFVLTRSSFTGTGHYAAHWSGDNTATWDDLYYSIPMMLSFQMFGISQVGADVCGFNGDTTEELCIRWMQLGSFYPFMRNHNAISAKEQDPAVFSPTAQEIMIKSVKTRYALLPYFYNLFYRSNVYGETVVRPLFFEFKKDVETFRIDRQFMVGPALLVTPVLEENAKTVRGYFPNETWYCFRSGGELDLSKGQYLSFDAPLEEINMHVRGGYIIPYQHPDLTTTESRKNPFGLIVALKQNATDKYASGYLFWDDGESLDTIEKQNYNYFKFEANQNVIKIERGLYGYETKMVLSDLKVFGVDDEVNEVKINGDFYDNFSYDSANKVQSFNVDMLASDSIDVEWY